MLLFHETEDFCWRRKLIIMLRGNLNSLQWSAEMPVQLKRKLLRQHLILFKLWFRSAVYHLFSCFLQLQRWLKIMMEMLKKIFDKILEQLQEIQGKRRDLFILSVINEGLLHVSPNFSLSVVKSMTFWALTALYYPKLVFLLIFPEFHQISQKLFRNYSKLSQ